MESVPHKYKKSAVIITANDEPARFYKEFLEDFWGKDTVDIRIYTRESFLQADYTPRANVYVVSINAIDYIGDFSNRLALGVPVVDIRVSFKQNTYHTLAQIPQGTRCMFVNLTEPLALECIVELYRHSLYNIHLTPMWPGAVNRPEIDTAITAGEMHLIPGHVKTVYDLGFRYLAPQTLAEICTALNMEYLLETETFLDYAEQFASSEQNMHYFTGNGLHYKASISTLLESSDDAIVGINEDYTVFCINRKAQTMLKCADENVIGQNYADILPFLSYDEFVPADRKETQYQRLYHHEGTALNVSIHTIVDNGRFRGLMVRMQRYMDAEDQLQNARRKLLNKGHTAKYTFHDIIGENAAIKSLCGMAARMAVTNSSVLITGESGTGKELLASAIHNASKRAKFPYIAINCAAMPEQLLESELLGYEDGAFTGARRNGKPGLFEHAHRGTLFLDEIEDMSPLLQVKLLRVLQEKEIMRVGGSKLINVDVRIIAATNENLEEKVKNGQFRKDLYYRLNTMQLKLPPLRERKDDIPLLLNHFRSQMNAAFILSEEAMYRFYLHTWDGNIRELRNYVEYFHCLGKETILPEDLPYPLQTVEIEQKSSVTAKELYEIHETERTPEETVCLTEEEWFVLESLGAALGTRHPAGRKNISRKSEDAGLFLSEQMVRRILKDLEEKGLVQVHRGRAGSRITQMGIKYLRKRIL